MRCGGCGASGSGGRRLWLPSQWKVLLSGRGRLFSCIGLWRWRRVFVEPDDSGVFQGVQPVLQFLKGLSKRNESFLINDKFIFICSKTIRPAGNDLEGGGQCFDILPDFGG